MDGSDVARPPPTGTVVPHSPWHSPVPYLFGGLAAMLGLIAFALLVLACSYWKLSGYLDAGHRAGSGEAADIEAATGEVDLNNKKAKKETEFEEKILVIMAGEVKPTFLATPLPSSMTSSFRDNNDNCVSAPQSKSEVGGEMHVIKQLPGNSHVHHHHHHQPEQN